MGGVTPAACPTIRIMAEGNVMEDVDYTELQRRHGGQYVARRGREILLNAATYDELADWLEQGIDRLGEVVVEYVEPADVVGVF